MGKKLNMRLELFIVAFKWRITKLAKGARTIFEVDIALLCSFCAGGSTLLKKYLQIPLFLYF